MNKFINNFMPVYRVNSEKFACVHELYTIIQIIYIYTLLVFLCSHRSGLKHCGEHDMTQLWSFHVQILLEIDK